MKLWIDDTRPPPGSDWHWARDEVEALIALAWHPVREISLDAELGGGGTAVPVAARLRQLAKAGRPLPAWRIHAGQGRQRDRIECLLSAA